MTTTPVSSEEMAAILANLTRPTPTTPITADTPSPPKPAGRPHCLACDEALSPVLVADPATGAGYHLLCAPAPPEEPAAPEEPPSTIDELRSVLIDYGASRPRSMQRRLGPSELGTPCQQQIARKLAGAPRRPVTDPMWAPFQGTAIHASMEQVVAYWNQRLGRDRWLVEEELEVDPGLPGVEGIRGHSDAYDTDQSMVIDWKAVGKTALDKLRSAKRAGKPAAEQISPEYRVQAHLYGRGQERKGRPVQWVRLVLLA
ncbi:MAG: hypothetical protein ACRCZP_09845, partial [Phycicoccus sp.]